MFVSIEVVSCDGPLHMEMEADYRQIEEDATAFPAAIQAHQVTHLHHPTQQLLK